MVFFTGVSGKLQFFDGTNYSSIGAVERFVAGHRTRVATTDSIATRKRVGSRLSEDIPNFNLVYNMLNFNLLNNYLIMNAEAGLEKFSLRYFDGQEYGEVYNIAAGTVEVATAPGKPIQVTVDGIAENMSSGIATCSWEADSVSPPMTWRQTTVLNISSFAGGVSLLSSFRDWSFRVNNNPTQDITGNVVKPAEVFWGKADYSGRIEIAKSVASLQGIVNQSGVEVQYSFRTRDSSPNEYCYTFKVASITQAEVTLPMEIVVHRIEWSANQLNRSTVS